MLGWNRDCEERSDEAIQRTWDARRSLDCFAIARPEGRASFDALWLAMTIGVRPNAIGLSYDFWGREGEKEPLREGGCPLVSGEGRIENTLTV